MANITQVLTISYNDTIDKKYVYAILYINDVDAGRLQIDHDSWDDFKRTLLPIAIFSRAFN